MSTLECRIEIEEQREGGRALVLELLQDMAMAGNSIGDYGYRVNTLEHAITWFVRSFNFRLDSGAEDRVTALFNAYDLANDYVGRKQLCEDFWREHKQNSERLNYASISSAKQLAARVSIDGADVFFDILNEEI